VSAVKKRDCHPQAPLNIRRLMMGRLPRAGLEELSLLVDADEMEADLVGKMVSERGLIEQMQSRH
jgi:hypothetical protein